MPTGAELRALIVKMRAHATSPDDYYCGSDHEAILEWSRELESLLRPQEPEQAARERLESQVIVWKRALTDWYNELGKERPGAHGILIYKDRVRERIVRLSLLLPDPSAPEEVTVSGAALDAAERNRTNLRCERCGGTGVMTSEASPSGEVDCSQCRGKGERSRT